MTHQTVTRALQLSFIGVVVLCLLTSCAAYNDDRPIYKWSPLWFNNYYRRGGILYKRFNEDRPIYKWSPNWFNRYGVWKRNAAESESCVPENEICAFRMNPYDPVSQLHCCDGLTCRLSGLSYMCVNLGNNSEDNAEPNYK